MIKGVTVKLIERIRVGCDEFGTPIYVDAPEPVPVENVLVTPATADQIVTDLQLYGRRLAYELSIPKGDAHEWENRPIIIWGQRFQSFGPVYEWIEANVPGPWNKKVKVERIE